MINKVLFFPLPGCPTEDTSTPFDTREFNLTDYLNTARENFIGRQWLFKDLEEIFQSTSDDVSGVVIVGDPGTGKSALAAQLICSRFSSHLIHRNILGYHMCKYSDKNTQSPGKFVRNLAEMIARRIPEYGLIVANTSFIVRALERMDCTQDPIGCFEQAVLTPLRTLQNKPSKPWYLVLDALDECMSPVGQEGRTIVDLMNRKLPRFPKWLKVVMTSRNETKILSHLNNVKKLVIEPNDGRNLEDISLYLTERLYQEGPLISFIKSLFGADTVENTMNLVSALLNKCQGNFLFVKEMLHYWETSKEAQKDPYALPKTLGDIYNGYFERLYRSGETFKPVRRILEVLVSTFDPISVEEIFKLLYWKEQNLHKEYEFKEFKTTVKELSHFLRYGVNDTISVYHLFLVDWLTSEINDGPFFISKRKGHEVFCDYYFGLIKSSGESALSKNILPLAQHIAHAGWKEWYVKEFQNFPSQTVNSTDMGGNRTLLHLAATINNTDVLKLLLEHFSCIDCEDVRGITPAFLAAEHGLVENVKLLVKRGASVNHKSKSVEIIYGTTVDEKASKAKHLKSMKVLYKSQAIQDPILQSKSTFWGSTMLHAAAQGGHSDVVRFLLDNNVLISRRNGVHLTALHLAAERGHDNIVKMLHEAGASADQTSLHHAAANNRLKVVKYLLLIGVKDDCMSCNGSFYWLSKRKRFQEGVVNIAFNKRCAKGSEENLSFTESDCDNGDPWKWEVDAGELFDDIHLIRCETALHAAVTAGNEAVVKLLVSQVYSAIACHDYTGRTPLHEAVRRNNTSIVKVLLSAKANVKKECRFMQTLEKSSFFEMEKYSRLGLEESLEYRKDVCHCGYTPLHLAARYGLYEIGYLLFRKKVTVEALDCTGATPLHTAACHNHRDFVLLLTNSDVGARINSRAHNGSTALHSAAICGAMETIDYLLYLGANISATDQYGFTSLHYAILDVRPENPTLNLRVVNQTGNGSETLERLFQAVEIDRKGRLAGFFEKEGYIKNSFGFRWLDTFIHLARITSSAELNAMDNKGRTALHVAAANGLVDAVNVLIQRGARLDERDKYGKTPLDLAVENATIAPVSSPFFLSKSFENLRQYLRDHAAVVHLLLSSGASFKKCDRKGDSLLHRAIANHQPYIVEALLLKGASLTCKDHLGRTPLVSYLQNGGRWIDRVLKFFNASVAVRCHKPFNASLLHLFAYRQPTLEEDNYFEKRTCSGHTEQCHSEDGPLTKAIKVFVAKGNVVIDTCLDAEGFSALHRAAQGANVVAIRSFLALHPNVSLPSPHHGLDAVWLAVLHRGDNLWWLQSIPEIDLLNSNRASDAAFELLQHVYKNRDFRVRCDSNKAELTLYHAAASRGLVKFMKQLLEKKTLYGLDVNCPNKHGITPMYLAKLYGSHIPEGEYNPWALVVDVIEKHGGQLSYPDKDVERYVIYNYLFGGLPGNFQLNIEEHIRHFLVEFVRSFNTSVACEDYKLSYDKDFTLKNPFNILSQINKQIEDFNEQYCRWKPGVALFVKQALQEFEICARIATKWSKLYEKLADSSEEFITILAKVKEATSNEEVTRILQKWTHERVTIIYQMWRNAMQFKDCIEQWFHENWYLVSDKAKLRSMFRVYLDASRLMYVSYICSAFDTATNNDLLWFPIKIIPNPMHSLSNFVRSRIRFDLNATWPLDFLVKLTVGEFAQLNYLKVLDVGTEPKTRVRLYSDKIRQILQDTREQMKKIMNSTKQLDFPTEKWLAEIMGKALF